MTLKNTEARSLIYICAVWSSLRPQEDSRSLPGSSINRPSPKQAINIPSSTWPWPAARSVHTEVKGGSMVALSVFGCPDLGVFSCPVLVWDQDTELLCSRQACWSSVAKLMSFWKQLIKGSRCGRWAISLIGVAGCPLPSLAGGSWSATQQPTLGSDDKWTISALLFLQRHNDFCSFHWNILINETGCTHSCSPQDELYYRHGGPFILSRTSCLMLSKC